MNKTASILTPPRDHLSPALFDSQNNLRSDFREFLIKRFKNLYPQLEVTGMFIIGSITSLQWSETTDIDVNVFVKDLVPEQEKLKLTGLHNEFLFKNYQHPINYFLMNAEHQTSFEDAVFGVYDVLENKWASKPNLNYGSIRNPEEQFQTELYYAKMYYNSLKDMVALWEEDKKQLQELEAEPIRLGDQLKKDLILNKKKEIENDYKNLVSLIDTIVQNRKFSYYYGWGVPRTTVQNIVYKYIDHSDLGPLFNKIIKDESILKLQENGRS